MKYAKPISDNLEVRYAQSNSSKLFNLLKEILHLPEGTGTVSIVA